MPVSRRALFLGGPAMAGAAALGGCDYFTGRDAGAYRMRLTLAVETPEGPRQASGVIEIAYYMIRSINGGQLQSRETLRGAAVTTAHNSPSSPTPPSSCRETANLSPGLDRGVRLMCTDRVVPNH